MPPGLGGAEMSATAPDGRVVRFGVFEADLRSGELRKNCWVCGSDGSNPVQLSVSGRPCGNARWSPDGRSILFLTGTRDSRDIWVVNSEGGVARPLISSPSEELQANWSRDGEWVYFTRTEAALTRCGRCAQTVEIRSK